MAGAPYSSIATFPERLAAVRRGSDEDVGELIATFRGYLLAVAGNELDDALRVKVAPSDIVQESMLQAQQHFGQFRGNSSRELLGWLREILTNNMLRAARMYQVSEMRQLSRERPINAEKLTRSPVALSDPSPTPRTSLIAREESKRLKAAVEQLPDEYRTVVLLRNWEDLPFEEIGRRLNRSADAARKLWTRAIRRLHGILTSEASADVERRRQAADSAGTRRHD